MHNSLIIIDDFFPVDQAIKLFDTVKTLDYTHIKIDTAQVFYEFGYTTLQEVEDLFSTEEFFNLVNLKLDTSTSSIYEYHISKMTTNNYISMHNDKNDNDQAVTFLYYLNDEWNFNDGGALEITNSISILPKFNRLVLFNNHNKFLHEVTRINSSKARYTITGWLQSDRNKDNN